MAGEHCFFGINPSYDSGNVLGEGVDCPPLAASAGVSVPSKVQSYVLEVQRQRL